MYFNKYPQPENFSFANTRTLGSAKNAKGANPTSGNFAVGKRNYKYNLKDHGNDVYQLTVKSSYWPKQYSQATLTPPKRATKHDLASISRLAGLNIASPTQSDQSLLQSEPGRFFGVSDRSWIMQFQYDPKFRFYGLGEKMFGFEHSRKSTKFWNTDAWADFPFESIYTGRPDPYYVSIPYLIIKNGDQYIGILVNNPYPVFVHTNPDVIIANQNDADDVNNTRFCIGSSDGLPELYFIIGPTLQQLTQKLQQLVGTTPLPPLWSLGHQQCRWGYKSYDDLDQLDKKFTQYKTPTDGLWLDIEYMDGFRVFTFNDKLFKNPAKQIKDITDRTHPVVPIIDPGVKVDEDYDVYTDGLKKKVFCQNPEGSPFVGFVWPGATVFPDFSLPRARKWWADKVAAFAKDNHLIGAWLDMNDPSTGSSDCMYMKFNDGKDDHETYHSQYALGMAQASRDGFLKANPTLRPFLLTRSGFISTSRHAAVWTGDNVSNRHYLKCAIPCTLNLSLSGIPFNGPDVAGFGDHTNTPLALDWYKTCFLFPFFRNHSSINTLDQEPWTFGPRASKTIKHFIQSRYKLLPYIYNLFMDQEEAGDPILRPLIYHYKHSAKTPIDELDDQFMVGPAIMQAPCMEEEQTKRDVVLPKDRWLDVQAGKWIAGGKTIRAKKEDQNTPLFVRSGSVLPMLTGTPTDNQSDLSKIELHIFLDKSYAQTVTYTYRFDDGKTFAYQDGERTSIMFKIKLAAGKLSISWLDSDFSAGELTVRPIVHTNAKLKSITVQGDEMKQSACTLNFAGAKLAAMKTKPITLKS
ncbi:TIM-barrel domain-containing protein [Poriferisphaera sp. WC338]|uniref:TIM-barrel domain-containing protein n=1 Tax=Poriferisphaera sp. WC338 TaxID=3425129 RepID=UPI003D81AB41